MPESVTASAAEAPARNPLKRFITKAYKALSGGEVHYGNTIAESLVDGNQMLTREAAEASARVNLQKDQALTGVVIYEAVAVMKPRRIEVNVEPIV